MLRRTITAIATVLALAGSCCGIGASAAAGDSFNQLVSPQTQATTPAATTPTTNTGSTASSTSNGGLSTGAELAIVAGAIALIGAIGFVIMRDARRAAPVKAHDAALAGDRPAPGRAERLRRQRQRAKQARRSRKRNR